MSVGYTHWDGRESVRGGPCAQKGPAIWAVDSRQHPGLAGAVPAKHNASREIQPLLVQPSMQRSPREGARVCSGRRHIP